MTYTPTEPEKDPLEAFNELQAQLKEEGMLEPKERNNEHEDETLKAFIAAGATSEEHEEWRRLLLIEDLIEIHRKVFYGRNPHLQRRERKANSTDPYERYYYFEETDSTGKTEEQKDKEQETRHTGVTRLRLELLAAERHLKRIGLQGRKQASGRGGEQNTKQKTNPHLRYEQLRKELLKGHNSTEAIKKAAEVSVTKALGQELPFPMVQCAKGYQVVEIGPTRTKSGNPSKNDCVYQRIGAN